MFPLSICANLEIYFQSLLCYFCYFFNSDFKVFLLATDKEVDEILVKTHS